MSRLSAPALRAAGCIKSPAGWHCARLSPCPHPSGPLAVSILLPPPGPRHLCRHGVPLLLRLPARRWPCPPPSRCCWHGAVSERCRFPTDEPPVPGGRAQGWVHQQDWSPQGAAHLPAAKMLSPTQGPLGAPQTLLGRDARPAPDQGMASPGLARLESPIAARLTWGCSAVPAWRGALPLLQGPAVGRRCRALGAAASGCRGAGAGLSRAVPGPAVSSTPHRAAIVPSQCWPCLAPACPASLGRGLGSATAAAAKGLEGRSHAAAQRGSRGGTEMCRRAGCWCTLCLACSPSPSQQSAL